MRAALITTLAFTACGRSTPVDHFAVDAADNATVDAVSPVSDASAGDVAGDACVLAPNPFCTHGDDVPGASAPPGFCVRRFASGLLEARTLSFAPNGDLFVGVPAVGTAGGASGGQGAIVVLTDDDGNGIAETHTFASDVRDVHGLAVTADAVYFTTTDGVWRTPYAPGQRVETAGARTLFAAWPTSSTRDARWTHGLAVDATGHVLASTGIVSELCGGSSTGGTVDAITPGATSTLAAGLDNPMYLRCHNTDPICVASELGDDGGGAKGSHERLFVVRGGQDFGYPNCAGVGEPMCAGAACDTVSHEDVQIPLNDTPFGFDWERGHWPAPYGGALFVAQHGSFFSAPEWQNAGVFWVAADATSHVPSGAAQPFVTGFGPGAPMMRRPSDVAFAADGRMFFADDHGGGVYWVAYAGCQ